MGMPVIGDYLLRRKLDFIWTRLLSPKSDIILKLIGITGSDLFMRDQVNNSIVLLAILKRRNSLLV